MQKKRPFDSAWTHVSFVFLFLVIPTLAFVRLPGESFFALTRVFVQETVANFVLLCFFYLNYYILLPNFFFRHRYILYIVLVILYLALTFPLPHLAGRFFIDGNPPEIPPGQWAPGLPRAEPHHPPNLATLIFDEFRRHLYLFFTAVFFSFLLRTRQHLAQVKEEKLLAELSSLKSQINPHFLFNTLNSIYGLSMKKDDRAPAAIIHLSNLMRYVIKDAHQHQIRLYKELEYIGNYMQLQVARIGNTTRVEYECAGDPGDKYITPLILITYIENAFKYGVNPDVDNCMVQVKINITDAALILSVFNNRVPVTKNFDSTGIGVDNTRQRLELLYPGKHTLEVEEDEKTYFVKLTLQLA